MDVRNGQYWATRIDGTGLGSPPGNEGWSGREGQPPGSSGFKVRLTRWGNGDLTGLQTPRLSRHWEDERKFLDHTEGVLGSGNRLVPLSPVDVDSGSWSVSPPPPPRPPPPRMKSEMEKVVHQAEDGTLQDLRKEAKRVPPEEGEVIVVGARRHRGF